MRRADRLFQIVGMLSRRRFMTAAQIAEELEISTRTVYRDVLDLITSGVPITGEAGVGYQLDPSYRLPPLTFNADEIEALVIGMRMVESWGDQELRRAARGVLAKVDGVVDGEERTRLNQTALFSLAFGAARDASQHLGELRRAINQRRVLTFAYRDERGEPSSRSVRPLGLFFWGRAWTLAAWCELRSDFRNFRTDRIAELKLEARAFEPVSPCTLADYVKAMESEHALGPPAAP
jgi:predicted DNA-binding transcriptional regulator YafY